MILIENITGYRYHRDVQLFYRACLPEIIENFKRFEFSLIRDGP